MVFLTRPIQGVILLFDDQLRSVESQLWEVTSGFEQTRCNCSNVSCKFPARVWQQAKFLQNIPAETLIFPRKRERVAYRKIQVFLEERCGRGNNLRELKKERTRIRTKPGSWPGKNAEKTSKLSGGRYAKMTRHVSKNFRVARTEKNQNNNRKTRRQKDDEEYVPHLIRYSAKTLPSWKFLLEILGFL